MSHPVKHDVKSLQPHSGALMVVLYHFLRFPDKHHFEVRMTDPFSKVYNVAGERRASDEIVFRIGKDWPCYTRAYTQANNTQFRFRHDHSAREEELRIEGEKLFGGRVRTENDLYVEFEGDFVTPRFLRLIENYRLPNGQSVYKRREYQIDLVW